MEETLSKLRSIGTEEISEKTHISRGKIEDILNKKYENFDKVKIGGFIKIIEREFNVDLHEWLEEFEASHSQGEDRDEELELRTGFIEKKEKSGGFWKLLLFLMILVAIGGYLAYKQGFIEFANKEPIAPAQTEPVETETEAVVVEEEEVEVEVVEPISAEEIINKQILPEKISSEESVASPIEESVVDTNTSQEPNEEEEVALTAESKDTLEFKIDPKSRLWIGKIDVETKNKESLITTSEYILDVEDDTLIITGHGDLSISIDGNVTNYQELDPLRFHLSKDGAKLISFEEFKELNGGNSW
ncbi:MAG: hypothetical protein ACLFOC_08400 [Campylobacterales bacterium]